MLAEAGWKFEIDPAHQRAFALERRLLGRSEFFSREQLDALKNFRLGKACAYAYAFCPYYRRVFDRAGVRAWSIRDGRGLRRLPLLEKSDFQSHLDSIVSRAVPRRYREYVTTGGSTGMPLGLYLIRGRTYGRTLAYEWRQYNWGGIGFFQRRAVIRGRVMETPVEQDGRHLYLSSFHLTAQTAPRYMEALEEHRPQFMECYASSASFLAEWILAENIRPRLPDLRAIFVSSETMLETQAESITRAFGCPVFNKYGNCEQATIIGTCPSGSMHEFEEYAFTEYLDENGNEVAEGEAEIVSTTFVNGATPLIRYRTGDRVELAAHPCSCGLAHRTVRKIVGRTQDYLIGRGGERVTVAAINTHTDVYDGVLAFQYFQEKPGVATIRVVAREALGEHRRARIVEEATYRSAKLIDFTVEETEQLDKTPRGKTMMISRRMS